MAFSYSRRIEHWLLAADVILLVAWGVIAYLLPVQFQTVLAWVMGIAWLAGLITVGGHNPAYLHPRYRIFVSMGLSLGIAALIGIFWSGNGHEWYMKGGVHYLVALGIAGTVSRFVVAGVLQRPAIQLVPCRLPIIFEPLLQELSRHPHVFVEAAITDPVGPLPERRPGYPIYLLVSDLHLREEDIETLMPLYAQAEVVDICELYESILGKVALVKTRDGWVFPQPLRVPSPIREVVKRAFDFLVILATAPISLPLIGLSLLAVKLTSPGPLFFRQSRLGRFGRPFQVIKIRTMVANAEAEGPRWTGPNDPRVTPVGRILRITGLDELPQLWNILCGEMSLVGPRPEHPEIAARLTEVIPFYRARMLTVPGLTGWAQLHQGGDVTMEDVVNKLGYDLYYLKNGTLGMDFRILLGTLQMVFHLAKPRPRTPQERTPSSSQ